MTRADLGLPNVKDTLPKAKHHDYDKLNDELTEDLYYQSYASQRDHGMSEAIRWLSENVTQEMLDAADYESCSDDSFVTKEVIAAALRKAAGK